MAPSKFRVGAVFPQMEIESDAVVIRDFAQAVEEMGFTHLVAYDHVIGARVASPGSPFSVESPFHEPLVLFSYLAAATRALAFMSAVVILPQRQTVLFAKQAANLDIFCSGRLQLGVGVGWNEIEYEALGVPFEKRGARLEDQLRLLRRLWTEPTLSETTAFHKITDAGLNPLPLQRPIPLWIGGNTELAMNRAARLGDGWIPFVPVREAPDVVGRFREAVKNAGRDPAKIGFENIINVGAMPGMGERRDADAAARDVESWRDAGSNGVCIDTMFMGSRKAEQHLTVLHRIAERLKLKG